MQTTPLENMRVLDCLENPILDFLKGQMAVIEAG
jgi:hypothetical protein